MQLALHAFEYCEFEECLHLLSHLPQDSERNMLQSRASYAFGKILLAQGNLSDSREQFRTSSAIRDLPAIMSLSQERNRMIEVLFRDRSKSVLSILGIALQARVQEVLYLDEEAFAPDTDFVGCLAAYRSGYDLDKSDALSRLIRRLKRGGDPAAITELGKLLADFLFSETELVQTVDFIVPVPQEPQRAQTRGYSISHLLAQEISTRCAIPILDNVITATGTLPELRVIPRWARMDALHGMFESKASDWISERHILIVDDVITSGATVITMSKVMKQNGAVSVSAIALAHSESSLW